MSQQTRTPIGTCVNADHVREGVCPESGAGCEIAPLFAGYLDYVQWVVDVYTVQQKHGPQRIVMSRSSSTRPPRVS